MIIINQSIGILFNSLVDAFNVESKLLITSKTIEKIKLSTEVKLMVPYVKKSILTRVISGLLFSVQVLFFLMFYKKQPVFVTTNPPFVLFAVWLSIVDPINGAMCGDVFSIKKGDTEWAEKSTP